MDTRIVERAAFTIGGVAADTSQATQAADIGPVAMRFFAPGFASSLNSRLDTEATYAVHSDWRPEGETYRLTLGYPADPGAAQPSGVDVIHIPAGRYTVFTVVGPRPQASIDAWAEIRAWRARPDLQRTGAVSFEVHDARARGPVPEVEIYIPAVLG